MSKHDKDSAWEGEVSYSSGRDRMKARSNSEAAETGGADVRFDLPRRDKDKKREEKKLQQIKEERAKEEKKLMKQEKKIEKEEKKLEKDSKHYQYKLDRVLKEKESFKDKDTKDETSLSSKESKKADKVEKESYYQLKLAAFQQEKHRLEEQRDNIVNWMRQKSYAQNGFDEIGMRQPSVMGSPSLGRRDTRNAIVGRRESPTEVPPTHSPVMSHAPVPRKPYNLEISQNSAASPSLGQSTSSDTPPPQTEPLVPPKLASHLSLPVIHTDPQNQAVDSSGGFFGVRFVKGIGRAVVHKIGGHKKERRTLDISPAQSPSVAEPLPAVPEDPKILTIPMGTSGTGEESPRTIAGESPAKVSSKKEKVKDFMKIVSDDLKLKYTGEAIRITIEDEDRDKYEIYKFHETTWSGHKRYWVPHGQGKLKYINGDPIYAGGWKKGYRDGTGEGNYKDAHYEGVYEGTWREGKPDGVGSWQTIVFTYTGGFKEGKRYGVGYLVKAKFKYDGDWKDDEKHGFGIATYADGTVYEGEWDSDLRSGFGVCKYPDGETYTGQWKENWRWGDGTSIHKNGNKFVGKWHKDMRQGQGTFFVALDQKVYEGGWWRNKRHGKGTYFYLETSEKYNGGWFLGKEDGEGEMSYQDGSSYLGSWVAGQREGIGILVYSNGDKYVGEWANGKRQGQQCAYIFKDYGKFIGKYVDDRADGPGEYFTFAGNPVTGEFLETSVTDADGTYTGFTLLGKRWGRGTMVYANGDTFVGEFKIGLRSGYGILTKADGTKFDGYWVSNEFTRFGTVTHSDGRKFSGKFKRGKKSGYGTLLSPNGETLEGCWNNDKLSDTLGVLRWANGEQFHGMLVNGKPHGRGHLVIAPPEAILPPNVPGTTTLSRVGSTDGIRTSGGSGAPPPLLKTAAISTNIMEQAKSNHGQELVATRLLGRGGLGALTKTCVIHLREWDNGVCQDGWGSVRYPSGDIYIGQLYGKMRHGVGILTYASGDVYVGNWVRDHQDGIGECRFANGDVYTGFWKAGAKEGFGQESNEGGGDYLGIWHKNQRHAVGVYRWPDGEVFLREYAMGNLVSKRSGHDESWKTFQKKFDGLEIAKAVSHAKDEVAKNQKEWM